MDYANITATSQQTPESWSVGDFVVERGSPLPFGATELGSGINFSLFSKHATSASLVLCWSGEDDPVAEIKLDPNLNRTGNVWHILVRKLSPAIRYGWRLGGPNDPRPGHPFDPLKILIDPYARALTRGEKWGKPDIERITEDQAKANAIIAAPQPQARTEHEQATPNIFPRRGCLAPMDFSWEGDTPLRIPMQDTIIYELHVRGYTVH